MDGDVPSISSCFVHARENKHQEESLRCMLDQQTQMWIRTTVLEVYKTQHTMRRSR